jgi:radical SAM superfamily enzyme YgiQ (UPF0313 family)
MKVSLIQPLHARYVVVKSRSGGVFKPAQLTMPYIAACTPPEFEVEIHDEIVTPLDIDSIDGDVVGITAVTPFAPRAYELATLLRARGKTVVIGGPHATAMHNEASKYVDAVVVGEGDLLWPQALRDWQRGELRQIYRNSGPVPVENLPRPRWDLLNPKHYIVPQVVQATRGCPMRCDFCSLRNVFPGYRTRPIKDVIREVEQIPYKDVVFWDDNLIGNPKWAKEFLCELKPLGKRWYSQTPITFARSKELVKLAAASGCAAMFIGLESFSTASLKGTNKSFNRVERYRSDIKLLTDHGIGVMSGLIFGFDEDTPDTFRETLDGAIKIGLGCIACSILTPYPGTAFFDRMRKAGRLTTYDWSRYTSDEVVFQPKNLTQKQIVRGHNWVGAEFYSYSSMLKRSWRTRFKRPKLFWFTNLANRRYFKMMQKRTESSSTFRGDVPGTGERAKITD